MPSNQNNHFTARFYPSRYLMGVLLLLHVLAVLTLFQLPLQWWAQLLITAVVAYSLYHYCRRYGYYKSSHSIVGIQYHDKEWSFQTVNNDWVPVILLKDSVVTQSLIILHAKAKMSKAKKNKTINVILFKDAVSNAAWRDLQFLLRRNRNLL